MVNSTVMFLMFVSECSSLQRGGLLPDHQELLVIADPSSCNGSKATAAGVGSGGATINAILVAAETLSALKGRSMVRFYS